MLCKHCGKSLLKNDSYYYKNTHYHLECMQEIGATKKGIENAWKKEREYSQLEWEYDELVQHLMKRYNGYNPNFSRKISEIICGERKDCARISAKELLEMWEKMSEKLAKASGHITDTEHKFYYDLCVVISFYPKYLDWKRKKETRVEEMPKPIIIKRKETENKTLDLDSLLF